MSRRKSKRRKTAKDGDQNQRSTADSKSRSLQRTLLAALCCAVLVVAAMGIWGSLEDAKQSARNDRSSQNEIPSTDLSEPTEEEIAAQYQRVDPRLDGWDSEVFQQAAGSQLQRLGKLLANPQALDQAGLQQLATGQFSCSPLRPTDLKASFSDHCYTVYRPTATLPTESVKRSASEAFQELVEPYQGMSDLHVKFKIVTVAASESTVTTECYYQAAGRGSRGSVQQHARWQCQWLPSTGSVPPRLLSIQVEQYEEVVNRESRSTWFTDCTVGVLGTNASFRNQLLHGIDHWLERLPKWMGLHYTGHHGLAIGDVNGDGLEDLYICRPGGLPNRLYVQNADGTATDVSSQSGVDWNDYSPSALFVDLDNDGDQDLVVAASWGIVFMANDGLGRFTKQSAVAVMAATMSLAAADYDADGDLDVYVCVTGGRDKPPLPYHDANNGSPNLMLRNDGQWRFTDVTEEVGLDENNRRFTQAASWEDYDRDGDLDLYVANDYGRNNLYQNDRGHFRDVAARAGVEDIAAGMSVDWGDYNGDGLMDLYVSNMFSSAGNRVTYQRKFKPGESNDLKSQFQRHARGNSLFENAGDGTFRDVSVEAGVTLGRWAWGSNFLDINNDGREDLFVANGYVTQEKTGDL